MMVDDEYDEFVGGGKLVVGSSSSKVTLSSEEYGDEEVDVGGVYLDEEGGVFGDEIGTDVGGGGSSSSHVAFLISVSKGSHKYTA